MHARDYLVLARFHEEMNLSGYTPNLRDQERDAGYAKVLMDLEGRLFAKGKVTGDFVGMFALDIPALTSSSSTKAKSSYPYKGA